MSDNNNNGPAQEFELERVGKKASHIEIFTESPLQSSFSSSSAIENDVESSAQNNSNAPASSSPTFATIPVVFIVFAFNFFLVFASAAIFNAFSVYYGIPPLLLNYNYNNMGNNIGGLIDIISMLCVGLIGDMDLLYYFYEARGVKNPWGIRKPLMLILAGAYIVTFCMLFTVPNAIAAASTNPLQQQPLAAWYLIFFFSSQFFLNMINIIMSAWIIESCPNSGEFILMQSFSKSVANVLGAVLTLQYVQYTPPSTLVTINAIGLTVSTAALLIFVPNPSHKAVESEPGVVPAFRSCMRVKEFRTIFWVNVLVQVADEIGDIFNADLLYIQFPHTAFTESVTISLFTDKVGFGVAIFLIILTGYGASKIDKLVMLRGLLLLFIALSSAAFFISFVQSIAAIESIGIIYSAYGMPMSNMVGMFIRDLVIFDTFASGLNREALYLVAMDMPGQVLIDLTSTIPQIIYYTTGYGITSPYTEFVNADDDDNPTIGGMQKWNSGSIWQVRIYRSFVMTALLLFAFYLLMGYPLSTSMVDKMSKANEKRSSTSKTGEEKKHEHELKDATKTERSTANNQLTHHDSKEEEYEQLIEHLGITEVERLAVSAPSTLGNVIKYVICGLILGLTAVGSLAAGLATQTINLDSTYPPLITAFLLLSFFYSLYEGYRLHAIWQMRAIPSAELESRASALVSKLAAYKSKLTKLLAAAGISTSTMESIQRTSSTIEGSNPIKDTTASPLSHPLSSEEHSFDRTSRISVSDRRFAPPSPDDVVATARETFSNVPVVGPALAATIFDNPQTPRLSIVEFETPRNAFIERVYYFVENYGYPSWFLATSLVAMFGILCAVEVVNN